MLETTDAISPLLRRNDTSAATPIGVVLNPNSRKNKKDGWARADRLSEILGTDGKVLATANLDELRPALRTLLGKGVRYLVSDGGDGALNWLIHEARTVLKEPGFAGVEMPPVIPTFGGTIDFVARKAGIVGRSEPIVAELASILRRGEEPNLMFLDSLMLTGIQRFPDGTEQPFERVCFAVAAGGVGNRFFDHYYADADPSPLTIVAVVARASFSFLGGSLGVPLPASLRGYADRFFEPTHARVTVDGVPCPHERHRAIHVGAFDVSLGGVFRVFPYAATPGVMHLQAGVFTPLEAILALPDLIRGGSISGGGLTDAPGREMTIEALGDELLRPVCDGEQFEHLSRLEVRPGPVIPVAQVVVPS